MTISTSMLGVNQLQIFTVYTIVDITCTEVIRYSDGRHLERNQQRNWETLLQAFALRAQPIVLHEPTKHSADAINYEFGSDYSGMLTVWSARIGIEATDVYRIGNDPAAILLQDVNQAPIILNLTETKQIKIPVFVCIGPSKNIYFKLE